MPFLDFFFKVKYLYLQKNGYVKLHTVKFCLIWTRDNWVKEYLGKSGFLETEMNFTCVMTLKVLIGLSSFLAEDC